MVAPLPLYRETLTGRTRGRPSRWSKKLVMQVELRVDIAHAFELMTHPPQVGVDRMDDWKAKEALRKESSWEFDSFKWRDATWEDVYAIHDLHNTTKSFIERVAKDVAELPVKVTGNAA